MSRSLTPLFSSQELDENAFIEPYVAEHSRSRSPGPTVSPFSNKESKSKSTDHSFSPQGLPPAQLPLKVPKHLVFSSDDESQSLNPPSTLSIPIFSGLPVFQKTTSPKRSPSRRQSFRSRSRKKHSSISRTKSKSSRKISKRSDKRRKTRSRSRKHSRSRKYSSKRRLSSRSYSSSSSDSSESNHSLRHKSDKKRSFSRIKRSKKHSTARRQHSHKHSKSRSDHSTLPPGFAVMKSSFNPLLGKSVSDTHKTKNLKFSDVSRKRHRDSFSQSNSSSPRPSRRKRRKKRARSEPRVYFSNFSREFQRLPATPEKHKLQDLIQDLLTTTHGHQRPFHKELYHRVLDVKRSLNDEYKFSLFKMLEFVPPETEIKDPKTGKFQKAKVSFEDTLLALVKNDSVKDELASDCLDSVQQKLLLELQHLVYRHKPLQSVSPLFLRSICHFALVQMTSLDMMQRIFFMLEKILLKQAPSDILSTVAYLFNILDQTSHMTARHMPKNLPEKSLDKFQQQINYIRAQSDATAPVARHNDLLSGTDIQPLKFNGNVKKAQTELSNFLSKKCTLCGKASGSTNSTTKTPYLNRNPNMKTAAELLFDSKSAKNEPHPG